MNNITPTITSDLIRLVPFEMEHLSDTYIKWLNDPETVKYSELRHQVHTIKTSRAYFESMIKQGNYFWAIVSKEDNQHIGNITAYINSHNKIAELAILIGAHAHRGKGLGCQSWAAAQDYLLKSNTVRKVCAGTLAVNWPMLNIFTKTEMVIEARRAKHYLWNNQEVDVVLAAKFSR